MVKYILPIILFIPGYLSEAKPQPIKFNPAIYHQILKNNPDIKHNYAKYLSKVISDVAKAYRLDPLKLTAILAQESMYQASAVNTHSNDYGIGQINHHTAKHYGFDLKKLTHDVEYSVKASAIVLKDFQKKYGKREKDYWTRYNSSDPEKRQEYKQLVARYM